MACAPSGLLYAAMTIALMVSVPSRAGAQISPGPLAKAHAGFEGATNCVQVPQPSA